MVLLCQHVVVVVVVILLDSAHLYLGDSFWCENDHGQTCNMCFGGLITYLVGQQNVLKNYNNETILWGVGVSDLKWSKTMLYYIYSLY